MKRVVADTNILVSALQFGGKPKQLLDLAVDGQIDLAASEAIIAEALRVLEDKFERTPEWLAEADRQIRVVARLVEPTESITAIEADPTDDRILECAVAAESEVIVSGDRHLLDLKSFRGVPIQRVADFLGTLQTTPGSR
ncbi:MAG: putative toxin-antitoxin system toxin component, PIN family [Acidobacteria bacterium]|nr:putative toxin-antitoxin system toxin component, PIN family [Acidobacteriota bacterium]